MGTCYNCLGKAVLTCTHNQCFEQPYWKYQNLSREDFHFYNQKIFLYIAWVCFHNVNFRMTGEVRDQTHDPGLQDNNQDTDRPFMHKSFVTMALLPTGKDEG